MITRILRQAKIEKLMTPIMPIGSWYMRVSPRMITCQEFNEFIFDYTEGQLTDAQVTLFERHMKVCPTCRNFMKTYQAAFKVGKVMFPYSDKKTPDEVPSDLLDAIRDVYKSD